MKRLLATIVTTCLALTAALAFQQDKPAQPAAAAQVKAAPVVDDKVVVATQLPSYPLSKCLVSDEELVAGKVVDFVHEGRLYRLCCGDCSADIKQDPAKFMAMIDAAVVAAQKPIYPLEICPISDEQLGGMGDPIEFVHGTRLVRFCCKGCIKGFQKNPAPVMQRIDTALIEQQKKTYALTTCPVSGEALGDQAFDRLYGVRLVRFCCKDCAGELDKDPTAILAKVDAAARVK